MSEAKKKMSKGKKALIIILSILAFLLVLVVTGGAVALHEYCKVKDYTISSASDFADENTFLIAHRGFRAAAPENTAPAFREAGKAGYAAVECDIYRAKDGVWVVQHDRSTYRMMDKSMFVEKATYEELKDATTDNGVNIDQYPDLKICTLKKFLQICQKYNMQAVIELKEENNQECYPEIIRLCNMYPEVKVTFISFKISDLQKLRELCDNDMMYLVQEITEEDIELAKSIRNCGIDFNGNKEKNYDLDSYLIKKCVEDGMLMGAWTIDDPEVMKKLLDLGVNLITTDCITY